MLKLFSTKSGRRYVYDSLTGKIITVHLSNDEFCKNAGESEIISQILALRIAENKNACKIKWMFPFQEYIRQLEQKIPSIVLALTDFCNLRCSYCNVSGGACNEDRKPIHMDEETLIKSLDFFIEHNRNAKIAHIGFYGGEALLRFHIIQKCVNYLDDNIKDKTPTYDISTNGLLLTNEVRKWLYNHPSVQVTCTVNGPNHDKYRKTLNGDDTLALIMHNLLQIKINYPTVWNNQIRFIANIDCEEEMKPLLDFYATQLGKLPGLVTNIKWESNACSPSSKLKKIVSIDFSKQSPLQQYYMHTLSHIKKRKQYKSKGEAFIEACFPCRVKMFVMTDGRISFCEQVSYNYSIGDVFRGFNIEVLENLYYEGEKLFSCKCKNCWAQRLCDICLASLIDNKGHLLACIPDEFCMQSKLSVEKKLQLFCQLAEEAPELIEKI